ncbi:MAG: imidazolonepropionase [Oscillospiraceae bacterium]
MKKKLILNAEELVTCSGFNAKKGKEMMDLHIIVNGGVYIEDGIIKDVDTTQNILSRYNQSECEIIDATGKCVLPGFIDSHTHLVFGGYRADEFNWRLRGDSYMEIMERGGGISNSVTATKNADKKSLTATALKRLSSMLSYGVTTVEAKSGYGLDFETEIKQLEINKDLGNLQPIELVSTYLGAHSVPKEYKNGKENEFIDYIIENVMPIVKERELAEFVDIFVEKNVFSVADGRKLLTKAKEMGFKTKIHADEIVSLGGAELAAEVGASSADHLLHVSDKGIADMAKANVIATVLPCTAFNLKENYAPARKMIDEGCAVAIATDFNPGSCFCENLALAFMLATLYMDVRVEEAVTAITINAAAAVGREKTIGSIDIGKQADFAILEFPSYRYIPYHIGVSSVETVIKKGEIVFSK